MVDTYFKYNSGAKEFQPIKQNKEFSYIVDAVSLISKKSLKLD